MVLSTTYSIKGTLSIDHIYDYLIVDEASQVDLATGVLAFSCARNIVIVGDLKQLPNVLTEDDIRTSDAKSIPWMSGIAFLPTVCCPLHWKYGRTHLLRCCGNTTVATPKSSTSAIRSSTMDS